MSAEGVPVAWCVMGSNGIFNIGAGDAHVIYGSKPELELSAEKANAVGWHGAPFRVVPLFTHPAAASAESIRAEVIEECARVLDVRAAFWRKQREEAIGRQSSSGKRARREYDYSDLCDARDSECQQRALALRALSARATKEG